MTLWTPEYLSIAPASWHDASDSATTSDLASGIWLDKSGNARDTSQPTESYRPSLVSGAVNGLDVLDFDGVGGHLILASQPITGTTPRAVFAVIKPDALPAVGEAVFSACSASAAPLVNGNLWDICPESGQMGCRVKGNALFADTIPTTVFQLGVAWESGTAFDTTYFRNGTGIARSGGTDAAIDTSTAGPAQIGFSAGQGSLPDTFDGYVCEIITFARVVSADERQRIEGYLAWKWGLEADLPIDHQYYSAAPLAPAYGGVAGGAAAITQRHVSISVPGSGGAIAGGAASVEVQYVAVGGYSPSQVVITGTADTDVIITGNFKSKIPVISGVASTPSLGVGNIYPPKVAITGNCGETGNIIPRLPSITGAANTDIISIGNIVSRIPVVSGFAIVDAVGIGSIVPKIPNISGVASADNYTIGSIYPKKVNISGAAQNVNIAVGNIVPPRARISGQTSIPQTYTIIRYNRDLQAA